MKVCIVSKTNIFLCPFIKKYLTICKTLNKIDLIYWNRHRIDENLLDKFNRVYCFELSMNEHENKISKLLNFYRFKCYCQKILTEKKYDKIIFLHNIIPIIMCTYLAKNYKGRYLIDIRDYTYEYNRLFFKLEEKAIQNSGLAVISSIGYKEFLPKHDYILCHNDPQIDKLTIEKIRKNQWNKTKPIQISFIGLVRFYEQNKKLLNFFKNDKRFLLAYYGQNSDYLKKYAHKNRIENTKFKGRFDPSETISFYENTVVINNFYGNNTPTLDYALSNKLYYAATFYKPILVCKNTYMEKISKKYSFGICLEDSNDVNDFYEKILSIDRNKLKQGCSKFMEIVKSDNEIFDSKISEFIWS